MQETLKPSLMKQGANHPKKRGNSLCGAENEPENLAEQLGQITEQLATKNRRSKRIWKTVKWVLITIVILILLLMVLNYLVYHG